VTHYYGLFEAIYDDHDVQPWPADMNYNDEQHRFGQVARQWNMIHPPGSDEWNAMLAELKELGVTLDPTMTAYLASRDVMRARTADWHAQYTLPSLWDFYQPDRTNHGSYYYHWTVADEIAWKNFYRVWMQMLDDYKDMGGRVTVSSDAGFIYNLFGFSTIEEMELLQEAGFHALEVIRAATMHGAETLMKPKGQPIEFGIVRQGFLADLVVVRENPGIVYTIKDGIVYDARELLADVAQMVEEQKRARAVVEP
jgi:imidazolonepropionase-like amidohydrolase